MNKPNLDNWVTHFPLWYEWIGGYFGGLNWNAPEKVLLESIREEIMCMVDVIDKRLAELGDGSEDPRAP